MKKIIRNTLASIICVSLVIPSFVQASEGVHEEIVTFQSEDKNATYDFSKRIEIEGVRYRLQDVSYEVESQGYKKIPGKVEHTETSADVPVGTEPEFKETIVIDDVSYKLDEVKELPADTHKQDVTSYTDYEYVVTEQSVPGTLDVAVVNEKTNAQQTVKCILSDVSFLEKRWIDSHIDIQFKDYNSTAFLWQGLKIANDLNKFPLTGYEKELLASVDLSEQNGRILKTYWTSEAYEKEGITYRDAKADIQKEVPVYRASYKGELQTEMVAYEAVYVGDGMIDSDELEYTIKATATYELENVTVYLVSAAAFLILLILIIIVIIITNKNSKKRSER